MLTKIAWADIPPKFAGVSDIMSGDVTPTDNNSSMFEERHSPAVQYLLHMTEDSGQVKEDSRVRPDTSYSSNKKDTYRFFSKMGKNENF